MAYKIIPRSYSPDKLLSLYAINKFNDTIGIGALICLKYNDTESLKKIFAILNASYNFCPIKNPDIMKLIMEERS